MLRIDVALPVAKCCRRVQKQRRSVPPRREPRISRLMALAIEFSDMLDRGDVADLTELATVAQVTQPRITQILNLTHLAPDIQEDLLFLDPPVAGKEPIHERGLRPLTTELCWQRQRTLWTALLRNAGINSQHRKSV